MARNSIWKMAALLLLAGVLLAGCGRRGVDYADIPQQAYENGAGYSLSLPADWTLQAETEESSSFVSPDQAVALSVSNELGGMEYYSLLEVGDMLTQQLMDELFTEAKADKAELGLDNYRRSISGTDQDGARISAELYIGEPFVAVRYYLLFLLDGDISPDQQPVVEGVIRSFTLTKGQDEIYQLMQARNLARQEAAANAAEEETSDLGQDEQVKN